MPHKLETETDAARLIRIGNEAQNEQANQYSHWEALARLILGDERDPKDSK